MTNRELITTVINLTTVNVHGIFCLRKKYNYYPWTTTRKFSHTTSRLKTMPKLITHMTEYQLQQQNFIH